jgi:lipopolysaccharide biosynthesis protein
MNTNDELKQDSTPQIKNTAKILVLYVFHEYNIRVEHFIKHAIFKDDMFDFIIICNNRSINISVPEYVTVIKRDNVGYDFGAWSEGLLSNDRYKKYDYFVFVNSSIIGPYLPEGYTKPWPYRFLEGLQGNIRLFGSTINTSCNPTTKSHVQSFAYAMNRETLEYLISKEIFSITKFAKTFDDAIWKYEVRMSREIIANGWNIGSLMKYYVGVDFTFTSKTPESYGIKWMDDMMYPQFELERNEVMFVKGNRGFSL